MTRSRLRLLLVLSLLASFIVLPPALCARSKFQGYVERGGRSVLTSLSGSTTPVQASYPLATVLVCRTGLECQTNTANRVALYSDLSGTTKPNPFTSASDGSYVFYADESPVDAVFSGGGISAAFTLTIGGSTSSSTRIFDVTTYGAKSDLRTVTDGAITSGLPTLTSSTAAFTSSDIGKQVQIGGAGVAGVTLYTTITAYISAVQVTLSLAASTTVTGATAKIYTDDGVAIGLASAALQSAGGGTLYFPPGTYGTYGKGLSYVTLGTFSGLTGVKLECDGCSLFVSGEHTVASASGYVFTFSQSNLIDISGFKVQGELSAASVASGTFRGVVFAHFVNGCTNLTIPSIDATGILAPVEFYNNNGSGAYDGLPHTSGIWIGILRAVNCIYGLDAQWSGDDITVDRLTTDAVYRSLYIYGSSRFHYHVYSKNAKGSEDVKLWGSGGYGLADGEVWYYSDATSTSRPNNQSLIELGFNYDGVTPVAHRNLSIFFDVIFPGAGTSNTGQGVFLIRKTTTGGTVLDTTDRGHVLDGLTLSGRAENYPAFVGFGIIDVDLSTQWGKTLDSWYNIRLQNLRLNTAVFSRLSLRPLKGTLTIDGVQSISQIVLQENNYISSPDLQFPISGQTKITNSSFTNQYDISGGLIPRGVIYLQTDSNIGIGWQEQKIVNTGCAGTCTGTLPPAVIGRSYTFSRTIAQTLRIAPQAADQIRGSSAVNKYLSMDVIGDTILLTCNQTGLWDVQYHAPTADFTFQP